MKHQRLPFVLFLACMLNSHSAYGQDLPHSIPKKARTEADYQPRTLREVAAVGTAVTSALDGENLLVLTGNILPSKVSVIYLGTTKPMPGRKRDVLRQWAQQYAGFPEGYTEPYQTEMLFQEDGTEHWLAIRQKDILRLEQGFKKGEAMQLNVIRIGGVKGDGTGEWVLLVEGFQPRLMK